MSDYKKPFLDLSNLLPSQFRDKTVTSLIRNLFNKYTTKSEGLPVYGFVGNRSEDYDPYSPYVPQQTIDRRINDLQPLIYLKHGTEEKIFSFADVLNKMELMGVDVQNFAEWGQSQSFNFSPPINFDKFSNYNKYYWVGHLCESIPKYDLVYDEQVNSLVAEAQRITPQYRRSLNEKKKTTTSNGFDVAMFDSWQLINDPDVVENGELDDTSDVSPQTEQFYFNENIYVAHFSVSAKSAVWKIRHDLGFNPKVISVFDTENQRYVEPSGVEYVDTNNLIIHFKNEVSGIARVLNTLSELIAIEYEFNKLTTPEYYLIERGGVSDWSVGNFWFHIDDIANMGFNLSDCVQATRPIIEYSLSLETELNQFTKGGSPSDSGDRYFQVKSKKNQLPLFNLYHANGVHAGKVSSIFFYSESNEAALDAVIGRRIVSDEYGDFSFEHGLIDSTTNENYFFKKNGSLKSIWAPGEIVKPRYVKPDTSGHLINTQKLKNFRDYYWFGHLLDQKPAHNQFGNPEYQVIEMGGSSGWSTGNFWVHVSDVKAASFDIGSLIQAEKPIIEFNGLMEAQLSANSFEKTEFDQRPQFNTYDKDGVYLMSGSLFEHFEGPLPTSNNPASKWIYKLGEFAFITNLVNNDVDLLTRVVRYYKLGDQLKRYSAQAQFLVPPPAGIVDTDPAGVDGTWEIPKQMFHNISNTIRTQFKQGDIHSHFISVIGSQDGFVGSTFGSNNFRQLQNIDLGKGGHIKQFNGDYNLFLGLMLQESNSPMSMIEFMRSKYDSFISSMREFVLQNLPEMITDESINLQIEDFNETIFERFVAFNSRQNNVVLSSSSEIDDNVARLFNDTTSAIPNCVVTLPYLGLADKVKPETRFDNELGINVIVHHDGHISRAFEFDPEYAKKIVSKMFKRANGQTLPGVITAGIPPSKPFKGQFWYDTISNNVFYYNVLSDSFAVEPKAPRVGDYWYDRDTNILRKRLDYFNGFETLTYWQELGDNKSAWTELGFDKIVNNLVLRVETELFNGVPPIKGVELDIEAMKESKAEKWDRLMQYEFSRFGAKYGLDIYSTNYDSQDAFTWNYRNADIEGIGSGRATWQNIYRALYNTERPNLEPWAMIGIQKQVFASIMYSLEIEMFTPPMWAYVKEALGGRPLSVNVSNNTLLPPYVNAALPEASEAVLTKIPTSIDARYEFGDGGLIELVWKKSIEYKYAELIAYFKLDPIEFVTGTWGSDRVVVDSYEMDRQLVRKPKQSELRVHNERVTDESQNGSVEVFSYQVATEDRTFIVEVKSSRDQLLTITADGKFIGYGYIGKIFQSSDIRLLVTENQYGLRNGDRFIINYNSDSEEISTVFSPTRTCIIHGMSQVFSQVARATSEDLSISLSSSILKNWVIKLGYRVGGLISTENLKVSSDQFKIDSTNMAVRIKENPNTDSKPLSAIRIQLAKRGSIERKNNVDVPVGDGSDWVYKIETFNPSFPIVSFFGFDQPVIEESDDIATKNDKLSKMMTFYALGGQNTQIAWKQHLVPTQLFTTITPFTITGIQNVATFIFGYMKYLEAAGWVFNNFEDPIIDEQTGRSSNWNLEVEKFIDAQYSGLSAGAGFVLNPFKSKVWIKTPRGVVANFGTSQVYDSRINQYITDIGNENISNSNVRVFRDDEITEVVSDVPMFNLNVIINEYEHVVLFDSYTNGGRMIYDEFLGVRVSRLLFEGEKQADYTGRISFGGHFVTDNKVTKNIDATIDDLQNVYNPQYLTSNEKMTSAARDLIGYKVPDYFKDLNMSDRSMFGFWRGLINNKGSNFSIDAFVNSVRYKQAMIDEYWAYKVGEYGDARPKVFPELKIDGNMVSTQFTKFLFLEDNKYEIEEVPSGFIPVAPNDEDMWYSPEDTSVSKIYFVANEIGTVNIPEVVVGKLYDLVDDSGKEIIADLVRVFLPDGTELGRVETGFDSEGSDDDLVPFDSTTQILIDEDLIITRVNSTTIVFNTAIDGPVIIRCYGPAFDKFNPAKILDYRNNTVIYDNIILWDPARDSHPSEAIELIDIKSSVNPAKFNYSTRTTNNQNYDLLHPWGEREVGTVWWNTKNLDYVPYYDDKIFPDINERISRWGAISDASLVEVAEWTESVVHPNDWVAHIEKQKEDPSVNPRQRYSGLPAFKELYSRTRTWKYRVVGWKHSKNPIINPRSFIESVDTGLVLYRNPSFTGTSVGHGGTVVAALNGRLSDYKLVEGAYISSQTPSGLSGEAVLIGEEFCVIGRNNEPFKDCVLDFASNYFIDGKVEVNADDSIGMIQNNLGQIIFRKEVVGSTTYLVATSVTSGLSQRLEVSTIPAVNGVRISFNFDILGITISAKTSGLYVQAQDKATVIADAFGSANHDVYAFSVINAMVKAPFNGTLLNGNSEVTHWVGWVEPTVDQLEADNDAPYNNWEPVYGVYSAVSDELPTIHEDIQEWLKEGRAHLKKKISKYVYEWGVWTLMEDEIKTQKFDGSNNVFTFGLNIQEVRDRVFVYKNGMFLSDVNYGILNNELTVNSSILKLGDKIKVVVRKYQPTEDELSFEPADKPEADKPLKLVQYKYDYQYTSKDVYDAEGKLVQTKYYFWVANKNVVADGRNITLQNAAALLKTNTNTFAILQGAKMEYEEYPTRYNQFIIYGLNQFARRDDSYKIRFTKDFTLRDTVNGLDRKNTHTEWTLIKQTQKTKIPKKLWDLITDSACGQNHIGEALPATKLVRYDEKHGTKKRYGFNKDQIFVDSELAVASIKSTIKNTSLRIVNQSNSGISIPDFISFTGFDLANLDKYFVSSSSTRMFLDAIWENAKPTQINEIFFTLLNDALSLNFEFTDIFKTSMISAHSIKLINTRQ